MKNWVSKGVASDVNDFTLRENGYSTVTCYTSIANLGSRKLYERNEFELLRTTNLKLHPCFTYLTGLKEEEYELQMK